MNKVIIMGRLTADPMYRQTNNGTPVCNFTVAVDKPYQKDKERTADFINCQAWRNTADFVSRYFAKGKPIVVEGSLVNNNYTDKNGTKHYEVLVLANSVEFTISDSKAERTNNGYQQAPPQYPQQQYTQQPYPQQQAPNYPYPPQPMPQAQQVPPLPQQTPMPTQQPPQQVAEDILSDGDIPF